MQCLCKVLESSQLRENITVVAYKLNSSIHLYVAEVAAVAKRTTSPREEIKHSRHFQPH